MRRLDRLIWFGLLLLGGCGQPSPYHVHDVLVHTADGAVLGTIIELGQHRFPSGITEPSAHVQLAQDPTQQNWYALQVLDGNYGVKPIGK